MKRFLGAWALALLSQVVSDCVMGLGITEKLGTLGRVSSSFSSSSCLSTFCKCRIRVRHLCCDCCEFLSPPNLNVTVVLGSSSAHLQTLDLVHLW